MLASCSSEKGQIRHCGGRLRARSASNAVRSGATYRLDAGLGALDLGHRGSCQANSERSTRALDRPPTPAKLNE